MKKKLFALLICILLFGLAACVKEGNYEGLYSSETTSPETKAPETVAPETKAPETTAPETKAPAESKELEAQTQSAADFNEEDVLSKLDVKEYSYINSLNQYLLFLVVTNNSESDISLSIDLTSKDFDGNLIGAKSDSQYAFEHGSTICIPFSLDEEPTSYEYEFAAKEETRFICVLSDLSFETSIAQNKAIVSVTNNGDIPAQFVAYTALFFNGETLVGFDTGYTIDDDSELKPGKTINKEASCYKDFDSVHVYLTGRYN